MCCCCARSASLARRMESLRSAQARQVRLCPAGCSCARGIFRSHRTAANATAATIAAAGHQLSHIDCRTATVGSYLAAVYPSMATAPPPDAAAAAALRGAAATRRGSQADDAIAALP